MLASHLSKKYPEKKELFDSIAAKCDECRVKAGIHYKSDGEFSKRLFQFLIIKIDLNIYTIVCSINMSSEEKPKTIYYFDEDPGYETLQKITQGYFEVLKLMDGRDMFLNEDGRYRLPSQY